jgi:hypothetical protein
MAQRHLWLRYGRSEPFKFLQWDRFGPPDHTDCDGHAPDDVLSAHGGITFAGGCHGDICHTPAPGEPEKMWWFGFDTAHAGDLVPGMEATLKQIGSFSPLAHDGDVYRDLAYVQAEANRLAAQLFVFKGRIYCERCGRRRRLEQLHCRCGSKGAWRFA